MASSKAEGKEGAGSLWRSGLTWIFLVAVAIHLVSEPGRGQAPAGGGSPQVGQVSPTGDRARLAAEAQEALRKGDYAKAIESLEALAKLEPGVAEIHANLATACYAVARYDDAASEALEALKLKPSLIHAHFFLGLSLAESDRCQQALPYLAEDYARAPDTQLKRALGTDAVRCAMSLNQADRAVDFLRKLSHDFPDDPDLLYLSSHVYSDLSTRASQRLLMTAPESYQAHQFNAEVLELEGKLGEAADEYRKVLSLRPNLAGIHYQLGNLLLAGERGPHTLEAARAEFEEELKIDPRNAAAEYELGEMARQARDWAGAIEHFRRASRLDPQFADALIGLGKSLASAGRAEEAIRALEQAVTLAPGNPNAHYQLSFAFRRLGRDQEAAKELAAYRETHDKLAKTRQNIRTGILGNIAQPQTDTPPD
jgi:tetratricopeptide (TPR) repeat protein